MDLIVVTAGHYFAEEAETINALFEMGLQCLHIRKDHADLTSFCHLVDNIDSRFHPLLSIHQHHELALQYNLTKLHFPERARQVIDLKTIEAYAGHGLRFSTSIHHLDWLMRPASAAAVPKHLTEILIPGDEDAGAAFCRQIDYIFYGPVFNSISKHNYKGVLKEEFVLPPHAPRIFAIGGVTNENLSRVASMGFDGAAVLGYLWNNSVSAFSAWKDLIQTNQKL